MNDICHHCCDRGEQRRLIQNSLNRKNNNLLNHRSETVNSPVILLP